jgi:hypothetical protein
MFCSKDGLPYLIDTWEYEVSVLTDFDVFSSIHNERSIARSRILFLMGIEGKFWNLQWSPILLVNNSVPNTQSIQVQLDSLNGPAGNHLILIINVTVESKTIVTTTSLGPEVELFGNGAGIDPWKSTQRDSEDMPRSNGRRVRLIQRHGVDDWIASLCTCEGSVFEYTGICISD